MITGANTNVRHRGIVFHVQTEDSGRDNPHVISHLYHHGTILASEKSEYTDQVDAEDLEKVVKELIDSQHGKMVGKLKAGEFDDVIEQRLGDGPVTDGLESPTPMPSLSERDRTPPPAQVAANGRAFGEGIVSQKPLDEVILEYLSEKARDRASDRSGKPAQKSRSSG